MDIFDRLVTGMSDDERQKILRQSARISEEETSIASPALMEIETVPDITAKLKTEPLLLRIWLFLKKIFFSTPIEVSYNKHLVDGLVKNIGKNFPDIYDCKNNYLLEDFLNYLKELQRVISFFSEPIKFAEDNKGQFFVFLGSLIMKNVNEIIADDVDPYKQPQDKTVSQELRNSLIRKLDVIFQEIPVAEKEHMYAAVQTLEWMKRFIHLPVDKFISRFMNPVDARPSCPLNSVSDELEHFAQVLCTAKKIQPVLIEALYMFSVQTRLDEDDFDIEAETGAFISAATEQIALIRMFINGIPLKKLTAVSLHTYIWQPAAPGGVEDWFIIYKTTWRKIFDAKWNEWTRYRKRESIKQTIIQLLGTDEPPQLANRPWETLREEQNFHHDISMGFLKVFFSTLFLGIARPLKIILIEGEFYQRENKLEYTDSYNELNHLAQRIKEFEQKLEADGSIGIFFEQAKIETVQTIQSRTKIETLIRSLDSEAGILTAQFCGTARSLMALLKGILSPVRDKRYDTLANISMIEGHQNHLFQQKLKTTLDKISQSYEILKELELIETPLPQ